MFFLSFFPKTQFSASSRLQNVIYISFIALRYFQKAWRMWWGKGIYYSMWCISSPPPSLCSLLVVPSLMGSLVVFPSSPGQDQWTLILYSPPPPSPSWWPMIWRWLEVSRATLDNCDLIAGDNHRLFQECTVFETVFFYFVFPDSDMESSNVCH